MKKICIIIGTRPQFIKLFPLIRTFKRNHEKVSPIIIHTGQHFDKILSTDLMKDLDLPNPDIYLNLHNVSKGKMLGETIAALSNQFQIIAPDYVIVFGDSISTLAGALAAKYNLIQVAHIESGLRSYNERMPEEINRICVDRISDILFCPTPSSIDNLLKEGYGNLNKRIVYSGDIMLETYEEVNKNTLQKSDENFILFTAHRYELANNIPKIRELISVLNKISNIIKIIAPLHPNMRRILTRNNIVCNFDIILPQTYSQMQNLLQNSKVVITDSGGLQKEAYFSNKKCYVIRQESEWIECFATESCELIYTNFETLFDKVKRDIYCEHIINNDLSAFGDQKSSEIVLAELLKL